jgi:intracellular sulfur oxidation DsrE/DsrF family protein
MIHPLMEQFKDRVEEVEEYIAFLIGIDGAFQFGSPHISALDGEAVEIIASITPRQQKMLYSSVYLQLYNLVESTITNCLNYISENLVPKHSLLPADLSESIRKEWLRHITKENEKQDIEVRLEEALALLNHFINALPVEGFKIKKVGGGNLDEGKISVLANRVGLDLNIKNDVYKRVKKHLKDDKGATELVVYLRNSLAHGGISFVDCGQSVTAKELKELAKSIADYIREVVSAFINYIEAQEYLIPKKRKPLRAMSSS